jgi:hypothetical protein
MFLGSIALEIIGLEKFKKAPTFSETEIYS